MALLGIACRTEEITPPTRPRVPEGAEVHEWNGEVLEPAPAVEAIPEAPPSAGASRRVLPAAGPDLSYADDEPVMARRVVYRVRLGVPGLLGTPIVDLALPAAELFVDVSDERLRARFVGTGWPVDAGAEVRIRSDSPGAYVIDGAGGRPLEPGALAVWFEGGAPRPGPRAYVRREIANPRHVRDRDTEAVTPPGALICALVAEWAGEPRSAMSSRCGAVSPVAFRVGFFRGERTADVPIEVPRAALRADEAEPQPDLSSSVSRAFFEPSALGRLRADVRESDAPEPSEADAAVGEGLIVENQSDGRMVVVVDGIAVGWVEAASSGHFVGIAPGLHEVGSMRPLGAVTMRPRIVRVPGRTTLRARIVRD